MLIATGVLLVLVCVAMGVAGYAYALLASPLIAKGVTISGAAVGGLTPTEAAQVVERELGPLLDKRIRLTFGGDGWDQTLRGLGVKLDPDESARQAYRVARSEGALAGLLIRRRVAREGYDVPVETEIDRSALTKALYDLAAKVERPGRDAMVQFDWDSQAIHILNEQSERKLNVPATVDRIIDSLRSVGRRSIPIVIDERMPKLRVEDLKSIDCVLSSYRTAYSVWQTDRSHNLALAAAALNGTLLKPGQELSYNQKVGPRTRERGYRVAPIFRDGDVEPGMGGGVCQPSTTLYNAVILANLTVVERHNHIMPVAYVPSGRDATVSYEEKIDLRFKNTLEHPIWLAARAEGGYMSVAILGSSQDKVEVELQRTNVATFPFETVEKLDKDAKPGSRLVAQEGRNGHAVTLWRIVKKNGQVVKRERLHHDYYPKRDKIVTVGPPAETPLPTPGAARPTAPPPTPTPQPAAPASDNT